MFKINGIDIGTTWGIHPQYNGVFNQVLKKPDIKPRYSNDWGELDGIEVDDTPNVVDSNEIILSFIGDNLFGYNQFIDYLIANPNSELFVSDVNVGLLIDYMECSSFSQYTDFNTFSIKIRENNPRQRILYGYLITDLGENIVDNEFNNIMYG